MFGKNPKKEKHNFIHEEIKSGLKSGNTFYHSVPKFLSSSLFSKNIDTDIQTCNSAYGLYRFETVLLHGGRSTG